MDVWSTELDNSKYLAHVTWSQMIHIISALIGGIFHWVLT
jgi:hypothetical protein